MVHAGAVTTDPSPGFSSIAFDDIPAPDHADVVIVAVPPTEAPLPDGPEVWAHEIFDVRSVPRWVGLLFLVRQVVVRLVGIPRGDRSAFDIDRVSGGEALIAHDDRHLDFRCGVAYDPSTRLLRITTTVRLKGWRGRLYFAPVSVLHDPVTRSMAKAAVRRITSGRPPARPRASGPAGRS
jgi:hypothetical protein